MKKFIMTCRVVQTLAGTVACFIAGLLASVYNPSISHFVGLTIVLLAMLAIVAIMSLVISIARNHAERREAAVQMIEDECEELQDVEVKRNFYNCRLER